MKKLMVSVLISTLCSSVAWAGNANYNTAPAKYELGQYSFDFSGGKAEETVKVKDTTPAAKEIPTMQNIQTPKQITPSKNKLNTQKDIINQVKQEEETKVKQSPEKETVKNTEKEIIQNAEKTKKEINPEKEIKLEITQEKRPEKKLNSEPQYKNPKKTKKADEKKINDKKKNKSQDMLFDFKIMDVQIIPEDSRTIERL